MPTDLSPKRVAKGSYLEKKKKEKEMIEEIFEYCERTYLSKSVGNTKLIYFSSLISKWYLMVEAKIITL